jgi:hypothetical protein
MLPLPLEHPVSTIQTPAIAMASVRPRGWRGVVDRIMAFSSCDVHSKGHAIGEEPMRQQM